MPNGAHWRRPLHDCASERSGRGAPGTAERADPTVHQNTAFESGKDLRAPTGLAAKVLEETAAPSKPDPRRRTAH